MLFTGLLWAAPTTARADTAADVEKANTFAMENYDLGDYAAAANGLQGSLAKLDRAGMAQTELAAQTHALLGLARTAQGDTVAAKAAFATAVRIAPNVALDDRYASDDGRELLEQARAAAAAANTVDCGSLIGIRHELVERADAATPVAIRAHAGSELSGGLVLAYAGADGQYTELPLAKRSGCEYGGEIPADAVLVGELRYFIVAKNDDGKLLASKGTAAAPFIIAVKAPADPGGSEATMGEGGEAVEDEIPDAIQAPKGPRKGGCAGCVTARGDFDPSGALVLLGVALLLRRRRARG